MDFSIQSLPIRSKAIPFKRMAQASKSPHMCFGRNTIYLVFLAFSDSLFEQNHSRGLFICILASSYHCLRSEPDKYKVVSSANDKMLAFN